MKHRLKQSSSGLAQYRGSLTTYDPNHKLEREVKLRSCEVHEGCDMQYLGTRCRNKPFLDRIHVIPSARSGIGGAFRIGTQRPMNRATDTVFKRASSVVT